MKPCVFRVRDGARPGPLRIDPNNPRCWLFADGSHFFPRAYTAPELLVAGNHAHRTYWIDYFFRTRHTFNLCNANLLNFVGVGEELNWKGAAYPAPDPAQEGKYVTIAGNSLFPFLYTGARPRFDGGTNVDWLRLGIRCWANVGQILGGLEYRRLKPSNALVNDGNLCLADVLCEIANESDFTTTEWQYHLIRLIKSYESTKPKQHPVGMTSIGYGVDDLDRLRKSPADWISPNPDHFDYKNDPPASDGAKVIILDTDHLWGVGGNVPWVWKSFLRGLNPISMDPWDKASVWEPTPANAEAVRNSLGYALRIAERMDLAAMTPRSELASTGYCLANSGTEYLVYQPKPGEAFSVELEAGTYHYEWLHPTKGVSSDAGRLEAADGRQQFKAPFEGDAVLYLEPQ